MVSVSTSVFACMPTDTDYILQWQCSPSFPRQSHHNLSLFLVCGPLDHTGLCHRLSNFSSSFLVLSVLHNLGEIWVKRADGHTTHREFSRGRWMPDWLPNLVISSPDPPNDDVATQIHTGDKWPQIGCTNAPHSLAHRASVMWGQGSIIKWWHCVERNPAEDWWHYKTKVMKTKTLQRSSRFTRQWGECGGWNFDRGHTGSSTDC